VAHELRKLGHDVRLMSAFYVKPYVKRGKTDAVDAGRRRGGPFLTFTAQ
jgi:transposase